MVYSFFTKFDYHLVLYSLQKLENRNVNITINLAHVFKVFEDFKFIQQLREEMDKVRPEVAIAP
jgi:hypothetical protein